MGTLLVLLSLVVFVIAIIALIRGHLRWARIPTRRVGLIVLFASLAGMVVGGLLTPAPAPSTTTAGTVASTDASPTTPSTGTSSPTGPVPGAPADVQGPFQVSEVVDGDTYRITGPQGISTVHLIGIEAPDTKAHNQPAHCFGREATQAAEQLVGSQAVWMHNEPTHDAQDRHGRQLVYLWLADGTLVNEKLIRDGFAIEYTGREPYQQQDDFRAAQDEARQDSRGLWAASTCNGNLDLPAAQPTTSVSPRKQTPAPKTSQAPAPRPTTPQKMPAPRETQAPTHRAATPRKQSPAPKKSQTPARRQAPPATDEPTPDSGGKAAHYANCTAARAAGAAPLRRGEPGYRPGLDRDNDGIACE